MFFCFSESGFEELSEVSMKVQRLSFEYFASRGYPTSRDQDSKWGKVA